MTTPAWMPPSLPEVGTAETEDRRPNLRPLLFLGACVSAFVLGGLAWSLRASTEPDQSVGQPLQIVDAALGAMISEDWPEAYAQFDPSCASFEPQALQAGFAPVLASYRGHSLNPLRSRDFGTNEIVLVFGEIDLGNERNNPLRAEFVYAGDTVEQPWQLCGLRIDEP